MTNEEAIDVIIREGGDLYTGNVQLIAAINMAIMELKKADNDDWIPLSEEKPPVGVPIMTTCIEEYPVRQRVLKYPCYYLKDRFSGNWRFCFETIDNVLLPEMTEVLAWRYLPSIYGGD